MLTKDDIKSLQEGKWDFFFKKVIETNFCRAYSSAQLNALREIYERNTGTKVNINWSCPHCVVGFIKQLGKLYFDSVDYYEAQDAEQASAPAAERGQQASAAEQEPATEESKPKKSSKKKK